MRHHTYNFLILVTTNPITLNNYLIVCGSAQAAQSFNRKNVFNCPRSGSWDDENKIFLRDRNCTDDNDNR